MSDGRVLVSGGRARADTEELAHAAQVLQQAAEELRRAGDRVLHARQEVEAWAHLAPTEAGAAIDALDHCLGARGCVALRDRAEQLAADTRRAQLVYEEAEEHTGAAFEPVLGKQLWIRAPSLPVPGILLRLAAYAGLTVLPAAATVLSTGGPQAVTTQRAVRAAAEDLQHAFPHRRQTVSLRGDAVDPRTLTPVQRVALGLLPLLGGLPGAAPLPRPLPRPSRVVADPSLTVAAGLPTRLVAAPGSESALLRRTGRLGERARLAGSGMVEILRTTAPDGRRSWTVLIPGTQEQWPGGPNPMDNLSNLQLMAGAVSDMEVTVATAMVQAGIEPGESVAVAAHSQGALVAARLLRDPVFADRFRVSSVLTAGGPLGGLRLPDTVSTLSLEDVDDPVVGLDGLANTPGPHHLTAHVDTRGLRAGHPHDAASYARGAELLSTLEDPAVQQWRAEHRLARGLDRPGAVTESTVFSAVREQ